MSDAITILGLYTIESDAIVGGMGSVFRVHHTGWKVDLAMKQPKRELFQNDEQKEAFIRECDHWIKLGLHPHIVSCYYVREISGIPSIFAEWMDGGSLKDFIKSGALYEGDDKEALERILDISIQFARGLHYAHEQGLIHQDVKPDNLLLTGEGKAKVLTAKVGDFGIAGARAVIADFNMGSAGGTIVMNGNAYTPAYCSPEQKQGGALTRRTDIWSWAVSVLEMFLGDRLWLDGTVAGMACEDYFEMEMRVPMPDAMKDLLRWCFKIDEGERPHDFGIVEAELLKIYQTEIGKIYSRPEPKAASLTADSLNNRALSYLDLGKPEEAEKCWEEALEIEPNHVECLYNYAIHLWNSAKIDDLKALSLVKSAYENNPDNETATFLYACVAILRCDFSQAETLIEKMSDEDGNTIKKYISGKPRREVLSLKQKFEFESIMSEHEGFVVTRFENYTLGMWSLKNFQIIKHFPDNISYIKILCVSPDKRYIVLRPYWQESSKDTVLEVLDLETGEPIHVLGHREFLHKACFSLDGKRIFAFSSNKGISEDFNGINEIKVWETQNGRCLTTLNVDNQYIGNFWIMPDKKSILTIKDSYKELCFLDVENGNLLKIHKIEINGIIKNIVFSPNGGLATMFLDNSSMCIFDTSSWKQIVSFNEIWMSDCAFSTDERYFICITTSYLIKIYDIKSRICIYTYNFEEKQDVHIVSVCTQKSENRFLVFFKDGTVIVIPFPTEAGLRNNMPLSRIISAEEHILQSIRFAQIKAEVRSHLDSMNINSALEVLYRSVDIPVFFNSVSRLKLNEEIGRYCRIKSVRSIFHEKSPNKTNYYRQGIYSTGNKRFSAKNIETTDNSIKSYITEIYELGNKFPLHTLKMDFPCVAISNDGKSLISSKTDIHNCTQSRKITLELWDVENEKIVDTFSFDLAILNSRCEVLFSSDAKTFYIIHSNSIIVRIFAPIPKIIWSTETILPYIITFSLNSNSNLALVSYSKRPFGCTYLPPCIIVLLDMKTGAVIKEIIETPHKIRNCIFCPDERFALIDFYDEINYWNIETGECLASLVGLNLLALSFPAGCSYAESCCSYAKDSEGIILHFDYEYEFPGWQNWDEGARPYLEIFLTLHPNYTEEDFNNILIPDLQNRGYGWLRPEGVRIKLDELQFGW